MIKSYTVAIFGMMALLLACGAEKDKKKKQSDKSTRSVDAVKKDTPKVTLRQVWATDSTHFITPECVTYDRDRNVFYVSNINRSNKIENDGYISVINADGSIKKEKLAEGLGTPLGNDFYNGHLFVSDNSTIVKIDIDSGSIIKRIDVEGTSDLNGIDIDDNGMMYAADSDGNKIMKVSPDGKVSVILKSEELNSPNGVFIKSGSELIIASSGGHSLLSLNLDSKKVTTLVEEIGQADGIVPLEGGRYLISNWAGEVYFIDSNMNKQKILDTKAQKINAADIGFNPDKNLMVVPTFNNNRLVAYKVNIEQ